MERNNSNAQWVVHSATEPTEPCLACRLTGAGALACVGTALLVEARRLRWGRLGQPRWAAFLVGAGIVGWGGAVARLVL